MRTVAVVSFFFVQNSIAFAETYDIDLTGLSTTTGGEVGPCYCSTALSASPVTQLLPGSFFDSFLALATRRSELRSKLMHQRFHNNVARLLVRRIPVDRYLHLVLP
jgi:hypothetical protein